VFTPAKRLEELQQADPSTLLGIRLWPHAALTPAKRLRKESRSFDSLRSGFRLRTPATLTPAKRLNLTKLFAIFLHKKGVFLR